MATTIICDNCNAVSKIESIHDADNERDDILKIMEEKGEPIICPCCGSQETNKQ